MKDKSFMLNIAKIIVTGTLTFVITFSGVRYWQQQHSLKHLLQETTEVDFTQGGDDIAKREYPGVFVDSAYVITLFHSSFQGYSMNPEKLELLRSSNHFHSQSPGTWNYDVGISDRNHNFHRFYYVIATGELGRDHEWCYVPNDFREWMKTLSVRPHYKYQTTHYELKRNPHELWSPGYDVTIPIK